MTLRALRKLILPFLSDYLFIYNTMYSVYVIFEIWNLINSTGIERAAKMLLYSVSTVECR